MAGAKVVVKPGESIPGATIIVRDGLVQQVGTNLNPPADARVWDLKGATIYAGLIDPCLTLQSTNRPITYDRATSDSTLAAGGRGFYGVPGSERDPGAAGPGSEVSRVHPETRAVQTFSPDAKSLEAARELGFTAGNIVPEKGIFRGTSVLVALGDVAPNNAVIKEDTFQHVAFETDGGNEDAYPRSLMGVIAVVRQTLFDARHYAQDHAHFRLNPEGRKRPEFNASLAALLPASEGRMAVMFEPGSALMNDRAARVARELGLDFLLVSSGQEWRRPDLARATAAPYIVPLSFPELPKLPDDDDWETVSLDQLRAWDWAPENAALLRQQGLELALTTYGLSDKKNFRKNLRLAMDRGLSEIDALAALTTVPARLCGVADRLGTIEAGKAANLTVVEGDSYFDPENRVREVWIDGRVYRVKPGEDGSADEARTEPEKKSEDPKRRTRELRRSRTARSPLEGRGRWPRHRRS